MPKILIANRLTDGLVVFRTVDGGWADSIAAGELIDDDTAAARLLGAALTDEIANEVIDPYLIDISVVNGGRIPDVYREAIRAHGPTIDVDASK